MKLKVPSIVCEGCGNAITNAIKTHDSNANVSVDISGKTVTIETSASEDSIKKLITELGHTTE